MRKLLQMTPGPNDTVNLSAVTSTVSDQNKKMHNNRVTRARPAIRGGAGSKIKTAADSKAPTPKANKLMSQPVCACKPA
jgi:hypothetical protein